MRRFQFKFPSQIRISGWDFGSSARAMNQASRVISAQADLVKVIRSTTERKSMSTKTTIKRVALVAVAALGFGMLSTVPSQAYTSGYSLTVDANDTVSVGDTATATITQTFYASTSFDSITVNAALVSGANKWTGAGVNLTVSDSTTSATTNSGTGANRPTVTFGNSTYNTNSRSGDNAAFTNGTYGYANDSSTVSSGGANRYVTVTYTATLYGALAAGTYTVAFNSSSYTAGSAGGAVASLGSATWTVTVSAVDTVATSGTLSLRTGTPSTTSPFSGTKEGSDSTTVAAKSSTSTSTDPEFSIFPALKNAAATASESMTVTVTGNAYISAASAAVTRPTSGTTLTLKAGDGVEVWSNGTAGSAVVTVSTASGLALGSKTVYFTGNVTKLAVVTDPAPTTIGKAGTAGGSGISFVVKATDALGYVKAGRTVTGYAADSSIISAVTCTEDDAAAAYGGPGYYVCSATAAAGSTSGKSTTLTIRTVDPAVTTSTAYITTTQAVSLGGSKNKVTITLDKSSYSPGEQMIVTMKATDSSGNPVYDGVSAPTLTSNKTIQGLSNVATTFTGGVADSVSRNTDGTVINSYTVFAPAAEGDFSINGSFVDAAGVTQLISATGTVTGASQDAIDAANEATDAANAATDAANAAAEAADAATAAAQDAQAAVAALATQVSSLIAGIKAQITSLTNLVIKIQKKVKA
jgi:hypothetical protein